MIRVVIKGIISVSFERASLLVDKVIASNDEERRGGRIPSCGIFISYSQRKDVVVTNYFLPDNPLFMSISRIPFLSETYMVIKPPRVEFKPPPIKILVIPFLR